MRRFIAATLTAALVVIGLSAVLIGTASASTPVLARTGDSCTIAATVGPPIVAEHAGHRNSAGVCVELSVVVGGHQGGGNPSWPNNPGNGHYGNGYGLPRYSSCSDYNRNNIYDLRRGDVRYNDTWDRNRNGVACDQGDVIVSNDGNCVTLVNTNRDYGNRYNGRVNQLINDARRSSSDGGTNITNDERRRIENASDVVDFRNRYNTSRDSLRTICNDPTPPVTIVTVPAPVTVTQAAPAPVYAAPAPTSGSIPSGSVNTGGFSAAYMLAHNRAI